MKQWKKSIKKFLINGGFFGLVIFLTYHFVFSNLDYKSILHHLDSLNLNYVIIAFLGVLLMLAIETLIIKRNLKVLGTNIPYFSCLKYTFAGNFFSAITPAATGGQPMQVYLMRQDGVSSAKSTLALMLDLSAYQSAIVSYATLGLLIYRKNIMQMFKAYIPFVVVGILFNTLLLILVLLVLFSDKLIYNLIDSVVSQFKRFKYKKIDTLKEKTHAWIERYKQSATIIKKHPDNSIINFTLMFIKIGLMFTTPFWIYKGLGLEEHSFLFIFFMQAVLHISYAALPLPGGVGIGETAFLISFGAIFGQGTLDIAMLLSRGIGFYFIVLISGLALSIVFLKQQFKPETH